VAALLWSKHADGSAADIRRELRHHALPLTKSPKTETGRGMLHLPKLKEPAHK
jgi:hypothetical protein